MNNLTLDTAIEKLEVAILRPLIAATDNTNTCGAAAIPDISCSIR